MGKKIPIICFLLVWLSLIDAKPFRFRAGERGNNRKKAKVKTSNNFDAHLEFSEGFEHPKKARLRGETPQNKARLFTLEDTEIHLIPNPTVESHSQANNQVIMAGRPWRQCSSETKCSNDGYDNVKACDNDSACPSDEQCNHLCRFDQGRSYCYDEKSNLCFKSDFLCYDDDNQCPSDTKCVSQFSNEFNSCAVVF
mmetsp:Transcript_6120/g.8654  ORF Transcript_6120/g.8654 Transcript_6120/m.8654 type:complete len:196 (+) Transcript_6120:3-590(+)